MPICWFTYCVVFLYFPLFLIPSGLSFPFLASHFFSTDICFLISFSSSISSCSHIYFDCWKINLTVNLYSTAFKLFLLFHFLFCIISLLQLFLTLPSNSESLITFISFINSLVFYHNQSNQLCSSNHSFSVCTYEETYAWILYLKQACFFLSRYPPLSHYPYLFMDFIWLNLHTLPWAHPSIHVTASIAFV